VAYLVMVYVTPVYR